MKQLKEVFFSRKQFQVIADQLGQVHPGLNKKRFLHQVTAGLDQLELKQRIVRAAETCHDHLPRRYPKALQVLYDLSAIISPGFSYMFMPDFVARYGLRYYDISIKALADFTPYSSSELAIRVFLENDFDNTIAVMHKWAESDDYHVRRLASEGSRPRLPWATRVASLLEKPGHALGILEALKADEEKYVQKSVANHINDISKDYPEWVLDLVEEWDKKNNNTAWIIRHGLRSLVKRGYPRVFPLLGFEEVSRVDLEGLSLEREELHLGDSLSFVAKLQSRSNKDQRLVVDYKIHYMKINGTSRGKVFKLKNIILKAGDMVELPKSHKLKNFSTRKHYPGRHLLEVLVNGETLGIREFRLFV